MEGLARLQRGLHELPDDSGRSHRENAALESLKALVYRARTLDEATESALHLVDALCRDLGGLAHRLRVLRVIADEFYYGFFKNHCAHRDTSSSSAPPNRDLGLQ